jgi:hypothetical protein
MGWRLIATMGLPCTPSALAIRASQRDVAVSVGLTQRSLAVRAATLAAIEATRKQIVASRELLRLAQQAEMDSVWSGVSCQPGAAANEAQPHVAPAARGTCSFSGCAEHAQFQPCFGVDCGGRRVLLREIPVRVCEEHRPGLEALLRSEAVHGWLQRKLHANGLDDPENIRVLFHVIA